ncbi:MAG TPA: hypothetical protein VIK32_12310, partial [Candidatus Limnocylindrales bacterium]
ATEPVPKPPVDLTWYDRAAPRPGYPCLPDSSYGTFPGTDSNSMRDNSLPPVELFPTGTSSSYKCTTPAGSITWDSSLHTLTISGVVFVDGSLLEKKTENSFSVLYSGRGTIYFNGFIDLEGNNLHLCPISATSDCIASKWETGTDLLLLVALNNGAPPPQDPADAFYTFKFGGTGAIFQGAAYAIGGFETLNGGRIEGPVIADGLIFKNTSSYSFTSLGDNGIPSGAPVTNNAWLPKAGSWRQVR